MKKIAVGSGQCSVGGVQCSVFSRQWAVDGVQWAVGSIATKSAEFKMEYFLLVKNFYTQSCRFDDRRNPIG
ncbi:MAG: hypothetical protein RL607_1328 [Bacteroidota bacterium]|jgi:hypothetical protein